MSKESLLSQAGKVRKLCGDEIDRIENVIGGGRDSQKTKSNDC